MYKREEVFYQITQYIWLKMKLSMDIKSYHINIINQNMEQIILNPIDLPIDQSVPFGGLKCPHGNNAFHLCISESCQKLAFLCSLQSCKCSEDHFQCQYSRLKFMIERLESKKSAMKKQYTNVIEGVIKMYQQIIDALSKDVMQFLDQIDQYNYSDGTQKHQVVLIQYLNQGNHKQINGKLIKSAEQQFTNVKLSEETQLRYYNTREMKQKFEIQKNQINEIRKNLKEMAVKHKLGTLNSNITSEEKMIKQFLGSPNAKFKLLYRASQNNFQASKFHQKCDGIPNTLVLVQTQFGNVIGGYTPLKWDSTANYQSDASSKTFLFSLTNKQKYPMINKQNTINSGPTIGPIFGAGNDLCIHDKSNITNNSFGVFPTTYNNGKHTKSQKSYKQFSGAADSQYFKVKEWEVYKIL